MPLKAGTSIIEYDGSGIHDTTAIDLVVQVLDLDSDHPVAGVAAQISGHETFMGSTTNTSGSVGFIAFFNGGGNFDLEIIHPEYACLRIKNLLFGSGQIVRLNIKLKKRS